MSVLIFFLESKICQNQFRTWFVNFWHFQHCLLLKLSPDITKIKWTQRVPKHVLKEITLKCSISRWPSVKSRRRRPKANVESCSFFCCSKTVIISALLEILRIYHKSVVLQIFLLKHTNTTKFLLAKAFLHWIRCCLELIWVWWLLVIFDKSMLTFATFSPFFGWHCVHRWQCAFI